MSALMESWRHAWRMGFAHQFSTLALESLAEALRSDDPRLLQGNTCDPPPMTSVMDWPVKAACPVTYGGVMEQGGFDTVPVRDAEAWFSDACAQADRALGSRTQCGEFLSWVDETPRPEMCRLLLEEIEREIAKRKEVNRPNIFRLKATRT